MSRGRWPTNAAGPSAPRRFSPWSSGCTTIPASPPPLPPPPRHTRERRDARNAEPARRQEARHGERRGQRGGHDDRAEEHEERRGEREPRQCRRQGEPRGAQQRGAQRDEERGRGHGGRARAAGTERGLQVQALHAAQGLVSQPVGLRRRLLVVAVAAVCPRRCRGHGVPRGERRGVEHGYDDEAAFICYSKALDAWIGRDATRGMGAWRGT